MSGHGFHILLTPLWAEWDEHVFRLVEGLHQDLPAAEPPVALHGRELAPIAEGVGAQYQLTLNGDLYDGRYRAAYFVIQIQLLRQAPPAPAGDDSTDRVVWRIDAMPVLERDRGQIESFAQIGEEIPLGEPDRLDALFAVPLRAAAADFFRRVRDGLPIGK